MNLKLILAVAVIAAFAVVQSEGRPNRRWIDENEPEVDDDENSDDLEANDEDDLVRRSVGQAQFSQFPEFPNQDSEEGSQETQNESQQSQGYDDLQQSEGNDDLQQLQGNDIEQSAGFGREEYEPVVAVEQSQNSVEQTQGQGSSEQDYLAKQPSITQPEDKPYQEKNSIEEEEKPKPWWKRWGSSIKGAFSRIGRDYNYRD